MASTRTRAQWFQTSPLMFIALCGHRRRIDAVFAHKISLRLNSIVVYNGPP
jgi:hypothetical protein